MYFKALIRLESFSFTQIVSLSLLFITTESLEIEKRRSHLINLLMEVYHSFLFFKIFFLIYLFWLYWVFIWRSQWHPAPVLLPGESHGWRSLVGCDPWGRYESGTTERLHFPALGKEMAIHSSVLAWRIPGTGEPGGLRSMGSHRVGHDWSAARAFL